MAQATFKVIVNVMKPFYGNGKLEGMCAAGPRLAELTLIVGNVSEAEAAYESVRQQVIGHLPEDESVLLMGFIVKGRAPNGYNKRLWTEYLAGGFDAQAA